MKSFFKKVAFVLALAMVVTMLPAKAVSAAEAKGPLLRTKMTLYIDGDITGKYGDHANVWYDKENYTATFASSDEDVATVGKWGKVTAVGIGRATITATFTNKQTGEVVESKGCTVSVKRNAVAIDLSGKTKATLDAMEVGTTYQLAVSRTDAEGTVTWKRVKVTNDKDKKNWSVPGITTSALTFESDNEDVFTVDKYGKVTAVGAGKANLTVKAVQSEKPDVVDGEKVYKTVAETSYEVNVVVAAPVITSVTVKSVTELELAVTGVTAENVSTLKITNVNGGDITSLFSAPTLSADGTTVTVKKYFNLINDEELTFAFGEGEAFTFTVKVGEAVTIIIEGPESAVIAKETEYTYKVVDENGIDLGITSGVTLDINDKTYATISGTKVTMYQVGKSVTLTATYNTGKLDANYMPITFKAEKVITCIEQPAITANAMTFMVATGFKKDNLTADPVSMYVGDSTSRLYAQVALSEGDPINSNDNPGYFTFETLTPSVLLVERSTGYLTPVSVNTARVLVKFDNGMGVTRTDVATIYVRENQKVVSIRADKTGMTLSNAIDVNESVTITITGTDQYGNDFNQALATENVDWPNKNNVSAKDLVIKDNTVTFNASGAAEGTYVYRVKCNDASTIVTVNVRTPGDTISYKVLVESNKSKLEVNPAELAKGDAAAAISFRIVGVDRYGIATKVIKDAKDVTVKKGDTEATLSPADEDGVYTANFAKAVEPAKVASGCAIIVTTTEPRTGYSVETGSFVISAVSAEGRQVVPATVEVAITNTAAPAVEVSTNVVEHATKDSYQGKIEALFKVDGSKYQEPYIDWNTADVADPIKDIDTPKGQSYVLVRNIKVYQKIDGVLVLHTVAVNRYISVNFD